jgi:2-polyprenyl-3-methyl-5-hydroxy-6-metoxy-1,4-benzoquinol methylase
LTIRIRASSRGTIVGVETSESRYDEVAEAYEAVFGDRVDDPATAALLDLVGDVAGTRFLDVPCGSGRLARELARRGASVIGVDLSHALIERARLIETQQPLGIGYLQADAAAPDLLAGEVFDIVACNYGLSDVDDLDGFLATVTRVLRPAGLFVFSILHPCFPGVAETVSPAWPPGGYYDERWWRAEGAASDLRREVGSNHRMLSTYVNRLLSAGLVVEALAEPDPPWQLGTVAAPMFLAGRCRNPPAS